MSAWAIRGALLCSALAVGCADAWRMTPPQAAAGAQAVVVLFDDAAHPTVWADALEGRPLEQVLPPFTVSGTLDAVYVAQLACPLDALGWSTGAQVLGEADGSEAPPTLELTRHAPRADATPEPLSDWPTAARALLQRVQPTRFFGCPRETRAELLGAGRAGVATEDGGAIVVLEDDRIVRVFRDGRVEVQPGDAPGTLAVHRIGDELWFVDRDGALRHAEIGSPPTALDNPTWRGAGGQPMQAEGQVWLTGGRRADGGLELAAQIDEDGEVHWFRDDQWSYSGCAAPNHLHQPLTKGGVARLAEDRVLTFGSYRVRECHAGQVVGQFEPSDQNAKLAFHARAQSPELGIVFGNVVGDLRRWPQPPTIPADDDFVLLRNGETDDAILDLAALGRDHLLLVQEPTSRVWTPTHGPRACPDLRLTGAVVLDTMPLTYGPALLRGSAVLFLDAADPRRCGG